MVKSVAFNEIRPILINNMCRKMLIPIIGSGFTRNCRSLRGRVPSGKDYKQHMVREIVNAIDLSQEEQKRLISSSFSSVSEIYFRPDIIPVEQQRSYLRDNFTRVNLEEEKKAFLSLPWPYIYTLNIDDGIEQCSEYSHVVHSNREVDERVFDEHHCVIKLHGDINDMLTYKDSNGAVVFTQKQYANSIRRNAPLLSKLGHDSIYENIIYIGCSLEDEIDLLAYTGNQTETSSVTGRYFCVTKEPTALEKIKLSNFGITHCVLFESYSSMYTLLFEAGQEAQKVQINDLENHKAGSVEMLLDRFEDNKPYLLFGKSLFSKERHICKPYFFISRSQTDRIISNMQSYPVQIIVGSSCCGKTYVLADIASRIRNRDVFCFETKERLTKEAFNSLLEHKNIAILADEKALNTSQIEDIIDNLSFLKSNDVQIILVANKNDHDTSSIIKLREKLGIIATDSLLSTEINNRFNDNETKSINPLLTTIGAGLFDNNKTIVDNIIYIGDRLEEDNKYSRIAPRLRTVKEIAALIALSTEKKVYSHQVISLDLYEEMSQQVRTSHPLIDAEATWIFEQSRGDNSTTKYVVNAEFWLNRVLSDFSARQGNKERIADAYEYIIKKLIERYGSPGQSSSIVQSAYKEYIRFDTINRIFCADKTRGKDGIALIRQIYERLNRFLSMDPNYMHQRAKCYIKSSYYENSNVSRISYLEKAFRAANVSEQVFQNRYNNTGNEKLLISIAHVVYTEALIICHKCAENGYSDTEMNSSAIKMVYEAMKSPYNSYNFARNDAFNYRNVLEGTINNAIANHSLVSKDCLPLLEELFFMKNRGQ